MNREDSSTPITKIPSSEPVIRLCTPNSKDGAEREQAFDRSHTFVEFMDDKERAFAHTLKIMWKSELLDLLERREWPVVWALIQRASKT